MTFPASTLADIAAARHDAFLDSPNLDPEWIAGWQAANKKVTAAIARIDPAITGDVACPVVTAACARDAYPVGSTPAFSAGWNSAANDIAYTLRKHADTSDQVL